ncbi:MAG: SDR family oxidoreductase [Deltaproteobacteria bacterium]|jgi:short-subunit dehydrogenase|nr:SDR family oxidoreductase [Deltaproteobacteria bacterium]
MNPVLIIGAKSDIAQAIGRVYAQNGYDLYLAARHADELTSFARDLRIRYRRDIRCFDLDVLDCPSHSGFYETLPEKPAGVVCAVGYLGDQKRAQYDFAESQRIIHTNFTGLVSLLDIIANDFETRRQGFIVAISSVAGDRGRKSNYCYGSAKAGLSTYLSGLRNRLHDAGVHVLTVKPGYVHTKMTRGMALPSSLTATPEKVARDIFQAQQRGRDILYTKSLWRWIMMVIRLIPEWKFKRLSI